MRSETGRKRLALSFPTGGNGAAAFVGRLRDIIIKSVASPLGYVINWSRLYSLWPVHLETACCSVELGAAAGARWDLERFGVLEAFGSLRQCDLLMILGTVTRKMMKRLRVIWEQMPEPKWSMAIGACCISGGLYTDSYNVVQGVDMEIPIDVYVPGCPPSPRKIIYGLLLLQNKIINSDVLGRPKRLPDREEVRIV